MDSTIGTALSPTPPIQWPRVQIGKQTLEVKWSILAEYILSNWGIDPTEVNRIVFSMKMETPEVKDDAGQVTQQARWSVDPRYASKMFELFAACVAHNYTQLAQDPPKAIYWATIIEDDQWLPLTKAVYEAMGKRRTAARQMMTPAPAETILTESKIQ